MGLEHLTRKFINVMNREVNLKAELDGKAGWKEVKQNIARSFRLDSNDVELLAREMRRKKLLEMEGRGRRRRTINI